MKKITVLLLILSAVFCLGPLKTKASTVIEGPEVIHKAKNQVLTIADILSFYQSDVGEVSVSFDEFTGNGNKIGTYNVQLYVTEGEIVYPKDIEVNVIDSLPAQIKAVGNYKDIYTNTSSELQNSTIITALESTGYIYTIQTTQMYILNNTYKANFEIPGSYDYVFRLVDSTGYDNTFSIKINVSDSGTLPNPDFIYEKPETMVSKLMNLLKIILIWSVVIISLFVLYKFFKPKVKAVLK